MLAIRVPHSQLGGVSLRLIGEPLPYLRQLLAQARLADVDRGQPFVENEEVPPFVPPGADAKARALASPLASSLSTAVRGSRSGGGAVDAFAFRAASSAMSASFAADFAACQAEKSA
jgi:hypothetical protein